MAEPEPALVLADQDAGEAHFSELLPQVAAEAGGVLAVAQRAHMADGRMLGDEVLGRVAEHRLFVVEVERHHRNLSSSSRRKPGSRGCLARPCRMRSRLSPG